MDRIWPRGVSRARAHLDAWEKDLSPSTALRRWFGHVADRFPEFRRRYVTELRDQAPLLDGLRARANDGPVTLVYSATDRRHNQAVVLAEVVRAPDGDVKDV